VTATPESPTPSSPEIADDLQLGTDLDALVATRGPLSIVEAVDYVLQACEAVASARALGVGCPNLAAADLFVTRSPEDGEGRVKIVDRTDAVLDIPGPDMRDEVRALVAILHHLLTGAPPSNAASLERVDVPLALESTIVLCLSGDPPDRFANVGELAAALCAFGSPETAHASMRRTLRVLHLPGAGIVPPLATTAPGYRHEVMELLPEEVKRATDAPPPALLSPEDEATLARFRMPRSSGVLITAILLIGVLGICSLAMMMFVGESERASPQARRVHYVQFARIVAEVKETAKVPKSPPAGAVPTTAARPSTSANRPR
jgi:hypothetical protein